MRCVFLQPSRLERLCRPYEGTARLERRAPHRQRQKFLQSGNACVYCLLKIFWKWRCNCHHLFGNRMNEMQFFCMQKMALSRISALKYTCAAIELIAEDGVMKVTHLYSK